MRDDLGIMISAKFNLISESANDGIGQRGAVESDFGVNKVPTVAEVQAFLEEAIAYFNDALGVEDTRLVTMSDFGFAESNSLRWPPVDVAV